MLVKITVNLLNAGTFQIRVGKPQSNLQPVQTYSSLEARRVLLELGVEPVQVEATLNLFSEIAPNQPLHVSPLDVPQHILWDHDFKL